MMYDMPTLFSEIRRKSKKEHICYECKKTISKNEKYSYSKGLWAGKWADFKVCCRCADVRDDIYAIYSEYPPFGEVLEWAREANIGLQ